MALKQDELNLTKKQIDSMSQEDWDKLPIVTGPKSEADKWIGSDILSETELKKAERLGKTTSPSDLTDLPKLEAEKPQPNRALKITRGILRLLSPTILPGYRAAKKIYGGARTIHSKLNKWKIDKRDAAREDKPPYIN